jgi:Tol biopolymer transport system component
MERRNALLAGSLIVLGVFAVGLAGAANPAAATRAATGARLVYSTGRKCQSQDPSVCDRRRFNDAIYAIARIGSSPTKLTSGLDSDSHPALSPNGRRIAFQRYTNTNALPQIWVMNANGSGQRQLTRGGSAEQPQWSPNGDKILFQGFRGSSSTELWVINADGSGRVRLTNSPHHVDVAGASWSPSGKVIAFARDSIDVPSDSGGIYVVKADGTGLKQLTPAPNRGAVELRSPAWSPDGRKIAYVRSGNAVEIWTMNSNGMNPRKLAGPDYGPPAWCPDSTSIAFRYFGSVTVIRADGTGRRTTRGTQIGLDLAWSPGGSRVAFDIDSQVAVMGAPGGRIKKITSKKTGFGIDGLDW